MFIQQQITGGDALLLYADKRRRHQHLSVLYFYDQSEVKGGPQRFKAILDHVEKRLGRAPFFRQRLVEEPFNLDYPYWINDPDFKLEFHVRHIALPQPGKRGTPREDIARLRRSGQRLIWQTDEYANGGHWLVLQRDDIDTVLKSPADFTNNFSPLLEDMPDDVLAVQQESMTFMDPPRHREYRSLVDPAFRPKALKGRVERVKQLAREVIAGVIDKGECELVEEVAMQVPMRSVLGLLGVPEEDYIYIADVVNVLTLAADPDAPAPTSVSECTSHG